MGCCLSRGKIEISPNEEENKNKLSDLHYDDKIKSLLTQPESNTFNLNSSLGPGEESNNLKQEDELFVESVPSNYNPPSNYNQPSRKPDFIKRPTIIGLKKTLSDRFDEVEGCKEEQMYMLTANKQEEEEIAGKSLGVSQVDNEDNKLDFVLKLINFEFMCDTFLEIFRMQFNPFFDIDFKNIKRTYTNLIKRDTANNSGESNKVATQNNTQNNNNKVNNSIVKSQGPKNNAINESSYIDPSASLVDLIDNSMVHLNSSFTKQNNFTKLNEPFIDFLFPVSEEIETMNEFIINGYFKKEIYNWIHFVLLNKSPDSMISEKPLVIGEGYLPINYLFLFPKSKDFHVKIPIRNTIEDITIGYLNVCATDRDSELNSVNTMDREVALQKISNFFKSKNIQGLNDIDPNLLQKNFRGYKVYDRKKNNLFHVKFTEGNINTAQSYYNCLMNLQFSQIEKLIYTDKKDKIYNMKMFNNYNYYTFLTVLNQIFGKLKGWEANGNDDLILERLKKANKKFFNPQYIQFNINDSLGTNLLLVNNILTMFITIKKDKYVEQFGDPDLKESYSFKNIFSSIGSTYLKIVKKIPRFLSLNNTDDTEFILSKNIQNNFVLLINHTLEDYLSIGMNVDNKNSFVLFKQFFLEEIESLKFNIKNFFIKDSEKFFFDANYILAILKMLINFVKFIKIFCYANKFSHNDVYIHEYIFNDTSLFIWLFTIFDKFIYNPRFFPMFLEFIYEFSQEVKGVYFIEFKKYFELPLFTMNFVPYLQELNKKNLLIWFFTSNIFFKFSQFVKNEDMKFLDFIGLSNKEIQMIIENQFNMLSILTRDDYLNFTNLRFREEVDDQVNHYLLGVIPNRSKRMRFLISSFHVKLVANIFATIANAAVDSNQFVIFVNKHISNYQMLLKLLIVLVLLNFESDKILFSYFGKNKNLFFNLYEKILFLVHQFFKSEQLKLTFLNSLEGNLLGILPKIDIGLLDKQIIWDNFKENLKLKIESSILVIPNNKNSNKVVEKLEKMFVELDRSD